MGTEFRLQIIAPNGIYFDKNIDSLTCVTEEGEIEVLPYHSEYLANLEISIIYIKNDNNKVGYAIGGGAIHFDGKNNICKLIVPTIYREEEIDLIKIKKQKETLEKKLNSNLSTVEHKNVERELRKAINNIKLKESSK